MYWFLCEERTRKLPVLLEYDLAVFELMLMMAARMLWDRCSCLGWKLSRKT